MKKNFIFFLALTSIILLTQRNNSAEDTAEELKLYLGQVKICSASSPTRIIIGNPNIADVTTVTKSEIIITPKSQGETSFVFWDNLGENSYQIKVYAEDMTQVKRRIDNLLKKLGLPEVYTKAEDEEAKILLLGRVKMPQNRERIATALGTLKEKTIDLIKVMEEEAVVEIAVDILELDRGATNTLGFTWPGSTTTSSSMGLIKGASTYWSTLFDLIRGTEDQYTLKLDHLIQEGRARILSRPRLTCQSGKEAELLVGGEKPIFTTSVAATTGSSGTSVEYKEYGIKLKVKPTVTEEKRVKVVLNIEVSDLESTTPETIGSPSAPTAKAYPLTKRNASTEVFLDDGSTLAIGGLIKQKTAEELRKFPWLADLPVLGLFFRQKTTIKGGGHDVKGDTELFITLTPKIVSAKERVRPEAEPTASKPLIMPKEEKVPEALAGYASQIQRRILENLTYPPQAKAAGFQGTVKLNLRLSYRGELLAARVKSSSGYKVLDNHALSIARGISIYPPFPPAIEQKDIWIDIPVSYRLN